MADIDVNYKGKGHRVSGHGIIYAEHVIMMAYLRGGLKKDLKFRLASEMKAAQKFDDLIIRYEKSGGVYQKFYQFKHRSNSSKSVTLNELVKDKGDFSLKTYFDSFLKIRKSSLFEESDLEEFVMWTNVGFKEKELKDNNIVLNEVVKCDEFLTMKGPKVRGPVRYKLVVGKKHELYTNLSKIHEVVLGKVPQDQVDQDIQDFFDKLVFAMNQPNLKQIQSDIKEELSELGKPKYDEMNTDIIYKCLKSKISEWNAETIGTYQLHENIKDFIDTIVKHIPSKIWFEVGNLVDTFTGREEELKMLDESLRNKEDGEEFTIISQTSSVSGLGGVGKTELARKYAHQYAADFNLNVIWINAESYETMKGSFTRLAKNKLNISVVDFEGKEKEMKSIVEEVYQYFANRKCLFVFDNAETFESETDGDAGINKFLVSLPPGHQVFTLITSRNQDWGKSNPIILDKFNPVESAMFIRKELDIEEEIQEYEVNELLQLLDCFPLALRQAISFIKVENKCREIIGKTFQISDYISLYKGKLGNDKELIDYKLSDNRSERYLKTTYTTWQVTQDIISNKTNGELALKILNIMAYLQPDNIHVGLIFSKLENDDSKLGSAIQLLKSYSMVNSGVDKSILNIHRLVQEITRIKLKENNEDMTILKEALKLLHEDNIRKCVDHFQNIWTFACHYKQLIETFSGGPSIIINVLKDEIRYKDALKFGGEATNQLVDILGKDHLSCLSLKLNMAYVLINLGKYNEAMLIYQEVYGKLCVILGVDHLSTLTTRHNMAAVLDSQGKYIEAMLIYQEVYDKRCVILGVDHPDVLSTRSNMALVLYNQGKYNEAMLIYREVYDKRCVILGVDHPYVLATSSNMAYALDKQGKYNEALVIYREIYDRRCVILGVDHPGVLTTRHNMASALDSQGKYNAALIIYQEVYDKRCVILGVDHPDTLRTRNNMALVLNNQCKYNEAMLIYQEVYDK